MTHRGDIVNNNFGEMGDERRVYSKYSKPLKHGCVDNWTWCKKNRSQEVVLPEPTHRKGESFFGYRKILSNYRHVDQMSLYTFLSSLVHLRSMFSSKLEQRNGSNTWHTCVK